LKAFISLEKDTDIENKLDYFVRSVSPIQVFFLSKREILLEHITRSQDVIAHHSQVELRRACHFR
jgi:hypothetical protein